MGKNKKRNKLKNIQGGISIETVVTYSIILTIGGVGVYFLNDKFNNSKETLSENVEDKYENKEFVIHVEEEEKESIPSDNDGDFLLGDVEDVDYKIETNSFDLPLNGERERIVKITLNGLKEIDSITVNNGGNIEILSIEGDVVTVKVTGGDVKERIIVSGQYLASQTKTISKYPTANYSDADGFVGTLTRYLDSYSTAYSKAISQNEKSLTNSFPLTVSYTEDGVTMNLVRTGASIANVIKGSNSHTKYVTNQTIANYSETVTDNGKTGTYTGTLTQYVHSGSASVSKTSTTTQSNTTNAFPTTITFQDGNYSGTLTKSGTSTSVVTKGSNITSKQVTGQPNASYSELVADNGKTATYTGTLTAYVSKGSIANNKTGTKTIGNTENDFEATIPYSETVTDNGKTAVYTGTLSKSGNAVANVIKGSPSANKTVTNQNSVTYNESIDDNGVTTAYTGTLTQYVANGSNSATKTGTDSRTNTNNSFENTLSYSETINDNGVSTTYTGTLSKNGDVITTVRAGSAGASKTVTNQNSATYNESINDNGITTAYTGTLTQYVANGSVNANKTVTDSRTNTSNNFDNTIPYTETINDNGISTTYSGTLSKNGNAFTTTVRAGSAGASKTVTNQTNANYVENITDNGVSTTYSGTLNGYVANGSASANKTGTGTRTGTTGTDFPSSISYSEYVNDNGIGTYYTGTLYKNGGPVNGSLVRGSASASKNVSGQTTSSYSEYVNDNGVGTYYTGTLTGTNTAINTRTQTESKTYNTVSSAPSSLSYSSGGYSGTLYKPTSYTTNTIKGTPLNVKNYTASLKYNWGWHCSSGVLQHKAESAGAAEYLSKSSNYIAGSTIANSKYKIEETVADNNKNYTYSGQIGNATKTTITYESLNGGNETGLLTQCPNGTPTPTDKRTRNTVRVNWSGSITKPDTREYTYTFTYSGNVSQYAMRYSGTVYKSDTRVYNQTQNYSGTVTKPDTRVTRYSGTVTKPDTRLYNWQQNYSGTVSKPDTRVYKYQGTVSKPDTRLYNYTQNYSGTVSKPDTRVYKYQGNVTKPDTREYGYTQNYVGTVSKPDTREYLYQGTVVKPDTREYMYSQVYTGTTYTPDTRVYRYQGNVTKPDTREYEYTQNYTGVLNVPERAVYMYQGNATKAAIDTRVFDNLYQYTIKANYYK